ncbi:phosphotransferase [Arthrobacter sp. PO-11]|uniref:Phosphotransferase n=2 Tax=Arthrobacter cavernae TaxID=2817681 RepID=A0A939HH61_9MICC|nr:phosphotransferase [Arthrobacter cavernae]
MREPLAIALRTVGVRLETWKLAQLHHRPGAGVTGIYEVSYDGGPPGTLTDYLCATTASVPADAATVVRLRAGDRQLTIWRHPADPMLPGLPWACDGAAVATELFGRPGEVASLRTLSYRPLRRAVLLAELRGTRIYLKAVRAQQAELLWTRHRMLADAGLPVAVPLGDWHRSVVALSELGGEPLAELFMADGAAQLDPHEVIDLLGRLPAGVKSLPSRPAWALRSADYARAAAAALPQAKGRIAVLADTISALLPKTDAGPVVPSHGDLYEANLLVVGSRITGLLDLDSLGPGHLVDDLACFLGHLAVLPALHPGYVHVPAAVDRFAGVFDGAVDPAALRLRAAGVALSLVAGAKTHDGGSWVPGAMLRLAAAEKLAAEGAGLIRGR